MYIVELFIIAKYKKKSIVHQLMDEENAVQLFNQIPFINKNEVLIYTSA